MTKPNGDAMTKEPNPHDASEYNLLNEECLSLAQAARRLPKVRRNKTPSPSTIYRWATQGRKSTTGEIVRLEMIRVGGTNCTSIEALARFFVKLNNKKTSDSLHQPKHQDPKVAEERARKAKDVLRRRGRL